MTNQSLIFAGIDLIQHPQNRDTAYTISWNKMKGYGFIDVIMVSLFESGMVKGSMK